jgi:hypothetical protein
VPAADAIGSGHGVSKDIARKVENIGSHGVESDTMAMNLAFDWTGLNGAFEVSGDVIAVLRNLDVLDLNSAAVHTTGVNRPVALNVVGRLLGECCGPQSQRQEGDCQLQRCVRFLHNTLL